MKKNLQRYSTNIFKTHLYSDVYKTLKWWRQLTCCTHCFMQKEPFCHLCCTLLCSPLMFSCLFGVHVVSSAIVECIVQVEINQFDIFYSINALTRRPFS